MDTELIDRIYEASFAPELWPGILHELSGVADAKGGLLFSARDQVFSWTASDNLKDVFQAYVNDGWFARCDRRVCMFSKAHAAFLIENDYWTQEELDDNPIYRDFFRPRDLGWSAGTGLLMPTGDKIVVSIERTLGRGPIEKRYVERLNELRPHLARSAMISARLGLKSAKSAGETLNALGLPTILLGNKGQVIETNNISDEISKQLIYAPQNRLSLRDRTANILLSEALETLHAHPKSAVRSFPLRDADNQAALVAHIIPISKSAHDLFAKSYALLAFTPVAMGKMPQVELIRSLFDLTASEARVARGLVGGDTIEEIAEQGGVALSTVRTQLRHVMEKTGCTRQAEIVALMANVSLER